MADIDDSSSHTRSRKAHLEPVVFLKLRNRWADINPPQSDLKILLNRPKICSTDLKNIFNRPNKYVELT